MVVKREKLFQALSSIKAQPSEEGRRQFEFEQSEGIKPDIPDGYFLCLVDGKKQIDFLNTEYKKLWENREWWGWLTFWKDWEGKRWILPYLFEWYPKITGRQIPEWLTLEIPIEELREKYL